MTKTRKPKARKPRTLLRRDDHVMSAWIETWAGETHACVTKAPLDAAESKRVAAFLIAFAAWSEQRKRGKG